MPLGAITSTEVERAVAKLHDSKAFGEDGVPAEYWKAVFSESGASKVWLVEFCQRCWSECTLPADWHLARISSIFKEGDPADCANYQPISLLNIGYKIFAANLLDRLRRESAEERLWPSQFGFRRGFGTEDVICIARRKLEQADAWKHGKISLLASDWAKAFDSIRPDGLLRALARFGAPHRFIEAVKEIYSDRESVAADNGYTSSVAGRNRASHRGVHPPLLIRDPNDYCDA